MRSFFKECPFVKELTPASFDSIETFKLKQKGDVFVFFYSGDCIHCQNTKPEWCKASRMITFVKMVAFNCEKFAEHIDKINTDFARKKSKPLIEGFPTLVYYRDGEIVSVYEGERNADSLLKYSMLMKKKK